MVLLADSELTGDDVLALLVDKSDNVVPPLRRLIEPMLNPRLVDGDATLGDALVA